MSPAPHETTQRAERTSQSELVRALSVVLWVGVPFIAANVVTKLLVADPALRNVANLIKTSVLLAAYAFFVSRRERRPVVELSLPKAGLEALSGVTLGALLLAVVMGALAALGVYRVDAVGTVGDLGAAALALLPKMTFGALIEETFFRLIILRLSQRSLGTAGSLLLSSLLFGFAHWGNEGATALTCVLLGVGLGGVLGAAYVLTGRLWLCAAAHLGWNFCQGGVFSVAVSGLTADGWLQGTFAGPSWLSGGAFGVEGSVVACGVCLAAAAAMMARGRRITSRVGL